MLILNLNFAFKARGITQPAQFLMKCGFSPGTASKIKNGEGTVLKLKVIEKICVALKCTPNDLLEWRPDTDDVATTNHPLEPLRRSGKTMEILELVNSLPYNKLDKAQELLKNL